MAMLRHRRHVVPELPMRLVFALGAGFRPEQIRTERFGSTG